MQILAFFLNGIQFYNNSQVDLTQIGTGRNALICVTNTRNCCRKEDTNGSLVGHWKFPNGSEVPKQSISVDMYRTRGRSAVLLHRRGYSRICTGKFICQIHDTNQMLKNLHFMIYFGQMSGMRCVLIICLIETKKSTVKKIMMRNI